MTATTLQKVVLPDGTVVTLSSVSQAWWSTQDGSGYMDPALLAPDPDQPRRHIGEAQLAELMESIKDRGVRESITVTPRHLALWVRVAPEYENAFFIIVSGHRRGRCAVRASVRAVPVKVKIYTDEKEHRLDASILNKGRESLTELEEGWEILALKQKGFTLAQLTKAFGYTSPILYWRMNLTRLHPSIQDLLRPELKVKKRLPVNTASALGGIPVPSVEELDEVQERFFDIIRADGLEQKDFSNLIDDERRFAMQKMLLAVITARSLNSQRSVNFIKEHVLKTGTATSHGGHHPIKKERFKPGNRRAVLENVANGVLGSVVVDWPEREFERIFQTESREGTEEVILRFQKAESALKAMRTHLEHVRGRKKPMRPNTAHLLKKVKG